MIYIYTERDNTINNFYELRKYEIELFQIKHNKKCYNIYIIAQI